MTEGKIGIISIGDMGMGIAKLLVAHGFSVATTCKGRSNDTLERARSASVEVFDSDEELVETCDVILSVVPPRDALATAQRVANALTQSREGPLTSRSPSGSKEREPRPQQRTLYFADLNAVAPSTVKTIASLFDDDDDDGEEEKVKQEDNKRSFRAHVRFIDGAIIGGPPSLNQDPNNNNNNGDDDASWTKPSIPTSGPYSNLSDIGLHKLYATLNMRHISPTVGAASGLKMCFASLTKGFTALAIQSVTTAKQLGVLDELRAECRGHIPDRWTAVERGLVGMPPKAYRWVREMEEIALAFAEEGGFTSNSGSDPNSNSPPQGDMLFRGVAEIYRTVAEDTVLGEENVGRRKRGLDVDDVATAVAEALERKRKKNA
ncbi:6-phosphogluconate dehydrogenase C-terminal domain-like protein [Xylariaceae sp. FL0594]|nr:6-phosphogluconate dehydrogenase C-terminal domain-like protein [Xylariaceae sp. FL0594]